MIERVTEGAIICFSPRSVMNNMSLDRNLKDKVDFTNVRLFEYKNKKHGIYREEKKANSDYYTYVLYELAVRKVAMRKENDYDTETSKDLMNRYCMEQELKHVEDL